MKEHEELPGGKKIPWSHSQEDFVTAVLAIGGHLPDDDDVDALGEHMLNMVDLDRSPFPDFRSMRLALQHGCDVATHEEMLNDQLRQYAGAITALQEAGIGFETEEGIEAEDDDAGLEQLQDIMNLNSQLSLHATGGPAMRFIKMSSPDGKLSWNASLHDFVALVAATEDFGIVRMETGEDKLELIAERYCSAIDVDYTGYSDFKALRLAYPAKSDYRSMDRKGWRLMKCHKTLLAAGPLIAFKRFAAFAVQTNFNTIAAEEIGKHWPEADHNRLKYLLDILFLPDEMIDEVLEEGL